MPRELTEREEIFLEVAASQNAGVARGAAPATPAIVRVSSCFALLRTALDDFELAFRSFLETPFAASWDNGTRNGDDVQYAADEDPDWSGDDLAA